MNKISSWRSEENQVRWAIAIGFLLTAFTVTYYYITDLSKVLAYIPDDAFFGFQMVKMFRDHGVISMDGETWTNGYHPLWLHSQLLLGFLNKGFLHLLIAQITVHFLAIYFFYKGTNWARNILNPKYLVTLLIIFPPLWVHSFNGLETSALLLMLSINFYFFISRTFDSKKNLFYQGILLGLLFLARTDSVFFVIILSMYFVFHANQITFISRIFYGLAGILMIVLPWLTYCQIKFGSILQSSGKTVVLFEAAYHKFHNSLQNLDLYRQQSLIYSFWYSISHNLMFSPFLYYFVALIGLAFVIRYRIRESAGADRFSFFMFALAGYLLLINLSNGYRMTWREWYSAPFMVFFLIMYTIVLSTIMSPRVRRIALGITLVAIISHGKYQKLVKNGFYFPQRTALNTIQLRNSIYSIGEKIGFTDAGMAAYFGHYKAINLDGAVNNEVQRYIANGQLFDYLDKYDIRTFVMGRIWCGRSWLMGYGTGLRYFRDPQSDLHTVLTSNRQIHQTYFQHTIGIGEAYFEKWIGPGWVYPVPYRGTLIEDRAWENVSYTQGPTTEFMEDGLWSVGQSSTLYLPLKAGHRYRIKITGRRTPNLPSLKVIATVGGQQLAEKYFMSSETKEDLAFDLLAPVEDYFTTAILSYSVPNKTPTDVSDKLFSVYRIEIKELL